MLVNTVELMNKGMKCLLDNLGMVEAERFIATVIREKFDYTKWQQTYFDKLTVEELNEDIAIYSAKNHFKGNQDAILK